jgi:hypothetical protein
MKHDLQELTEKMINLFGQIPNNFALENAKLHFKRAINEIQNVQVKRTRRTVQQSNNNYQTLSYDVAKQALDKIDELIEIEQKSLGNKNQPNQNKLMFE